MPLRLPHAAHLSRRHFTRVLAAAAVALLTGAAGCGGDDGPTGSSYNGTYALQTIEGIAVPVQFSDGTVLRSGSLTISGGSSWTATLVVDGQSLPESGSVSRNGDALQFTGGAEFTGRLSSDSRTITADVDLFEDGQTYQMVFTR